VFVNVYPVEKRCCVLYSLSTNWNCIHIG